MIPSIVIFDLDKTLALSKEPIKPSMAACLRDLLARTKITVISGGKLDQIKHQVVEHLPGDAVLTNFYLLPTSGAALYSHDGDWDMVYEEHLSSDEALTIKDAMQESCEETGVINLAEPSFGERIEYRGAEVTLSALGQQAPIHKKEHWDPDGTKHQKLLEAIQKRLPHYDVKVGGSTSIDVTKHGINKAYGLRRLSEHLHIPISEMIYIGDALFPGGNDEVVKETGIETRSTSGPDETEKIIRKLLA